MFQSFREQYYCTRSYTKDFDNLLKIANENKDSLS